MNSFFQLIFSKSINALFFQKKPFIVYQSLFFFSVCSRFLFPVLVVHIFPSLFKFVMWNFWLFIEIGCKEGSRKCDGDAIPSRHERQTGSSKVLGKVSTISNRMAGTMKQWEKYVNCR
jgi:hypothetical protein